MTKEDIIKIIRKSPDVPKDYGSEIAKALWPHIEAAIEDADMRGFKRGFNKGRKTGREEAPR